MTMMTMTMTMTNETAKHPPIAIGGCCYDGGVSMRTQWVISAVLSAGVALDLLSFIGWSMPALLPWITAHVLGAVAILTFRNLRFGVAAVLLELLWGSHGYLLRIPGQGIDLSLRTALFLIVLGATAWHLRTALARRMLWATIRTHPARWPAFVFLATLALGGILGVLRHPFDRVFFDMNAWGFLLLAPAFLIAAARMTRMDRADNTDTRIRSNWSDVRCQMSDVVLAGALYLILRSYALLFFFGHDLGGTWMPLYQWVRDMRLGEVTIFPGAFPRVFMPSMMLLFPAIAIAMTRIRGWSRIREYANDRVRLGQKTFSHSAECENVVPRRYPMLALGVFGGGVAVLLLSLSRSYWLAGVALIVVGLMWAIVGALRQRTHIHGSPEDLSHFRTKLRKTFRDVLVLVGATIIAVVVAVAIVRLPYPKPLTTAGIGSTLLARLSVDAAVSNRWQQLGPLRGAILQHPILGSGFGAAVTYETKDPRTLAAFPNRQYTTTAFEWGYLDDLLERGLIGLLAELWLVGALIWYGLKTPLPRHSSLFTLHFSLSFGLLAIAIVHATSPYLNHPLGIGVVLWLFTMESPRSLGEERSDSVTR